MPSDWIHWKCKNFLQLLLKWNDLVRLDGDYIRYMRHYINSRLHWNIDKKHNQTQPQTQPSTIFAGIRRLTWMNCTANVKSHSLLLWTSTSVRRFSSDVFSIIAAWWKSVVWWPLTFDTCQHFNIDQHQTSSACAKNS